MKRCLMLALLLFVVGVSLFLLQIWFPVMDVELLLKVEFTLGGVLLMIVGVCFVANEYRETERIRSGRGLND